MRVTQASPSSVLPAGLPELNQRKSRVPLFAAAACVALALGGCAGKTVLGPKEGAQVAQQANPVVDPAQGAVTTKASQIQRFMWFFSPYRPDIQQGNFVSKEMLAQLKPGMTRDQVRFVMGSPLLNDIFHENRWDYPFRFARGDGELTTSSVVLHFDKEGKLERFEGGELPTEREYIARIAGPIRQFQKDEKRNAENQPAAARAPLPSGQDSGNRNRVEISTRPAGQ
jgi:outer membrane protein assembly factor BamE